MESRTLALATEFNDLGWFWTLK